MEKKISKIFMNGRSQAVRLPKEFRLDCNEVYISKEGNNIILSPKHKSWQEFFDQVPLPSEDFMNEPFDLKPEEREGL